MFLVILGYYEVLNTLSVSMMGTQTKQKHLEGWQSTSGDCGIAPLAFYLYQSRFCIAASI